MYFCAGAAAETDHVLTGAFCTKVNGRIVEFHGEPGQTVSRIVVKVRIDQYERFLPAFDESTQPPTMSFPTPPEADDLVELLQFIESVGCFWFGLKRVQWNEVTFEWEPESQGERDRLVIFSFSSRHEYQPNSQQVMPQILSEVLEDRGRLTPLVLPLAFYREGNNDYTTHRYINAFFNYYFFIEDLFGDGHSKNVRILQAFKRSTELRAAVHKAASDIRSGNLPEHTQALTAFLKGERQSWDPDGFMTLLVQMRGNLHHFSQKSTKLKGHPLNHSTFASLAFFAMAVCLNVIAKRIAHPRV